MYLASTPPLKRVFYWENEMNLRVWWVPQVPCDSFFVPVCSVNEGVFLMDALAKYDLFQFENNIKPDYSNAGGLQMFDFTDLEDGPDGSWVDWYDRETGFDDPEEYLEHLADMVKP